MLWICWTAAILAALLTAFIGHRVSKDSSDDLFYIELVVYPFIAGAITFIVVRRVIETSGLM